MKKFLNIFLSFMLLFSLSLASACSINDGHKYEIAVIVKATDSAFWKNVNMGVSAAATEYNCNVTFSGPETEEDYIGQNQLIDRAVEDGVDAIVLSAIDYEKNTANVEAAYNSGIPIIVIDSDIHSNIKRSIIGTDDYQAGISAYTALKQTNKKIYLGIVNFDKVTLNGQLRELGLTNSIKDDADIEILETVYAESNIESASAATIKLINDYPHLNAIVTFNEWTTLGVGSAIEKSGREDIFAVGFDSHVKSLSHLERGIMDTLIVQNPYAMGYLGIEYAVNSVKSGKMLENRIDTGTTLITKNNMFTEQNQKLVFPF